MNKCDCGSYAINIDGKRIVCDVCFWRIKYEAAEAKVEAIKKYTHHKLACDRNSRPTKVSEFEVQRRPCSCGLDDLLKKQTGEL